MVQESRHGRVTIDQKEPEISTDVVVSSFSRVDHDMSGRQITFENITVLVNSRNPIIIDQHCNRNGMGNDCYTNQGCNVRHCAWIFNFFF